MYRSNIYLKMILQVSFFVLAFNSVFAQTPAIEFKLQLLAADQWGVFARPTGVAPGDNLITGSGQVTVVMPLHFGWNSLTSVNGIWTSNAPVHGPIENPTKTYTSFGWQASDVQFQVGNETLLFTFRRTDPCPDSIYLIENGVDPFDILPNSYSSNPGNEITSFEPGGLYSYRANYSPSAWSCHDCDGDGILNAFEDTDGDGVFDGDIEVDIDSDGFADNNEDIDGDNHFDQGEDVNHNGVLDVGEDRDSDGVLDLTEDLNGNGMFNTPLEDIDGDGHFDSVNEDLDGDGHMDGDEDADNDGYLDPDVSQICNPCDPIHPESAAMELVGGADVICANDLGDTAYFQVVIEGGWPPYTVNYTDGTTNFAVTDYYSGDSIAFVPTESVTLDLISVIDSFSCLLDTALTGGLHIEVHGPISVDDQPEPVVECHGNNTSFCIGTDNDGDGTVYQKWQVNTGSGWVDIQDGSVYDNTDSLCLLVSNVAGKDNYQYRAKIFTSVCDTVFSDPALLRVEGPLSISSQPVNFVNCDSETASFSAVAVNGGAVGTMGYQWQYSTNGTTFYDLPNGAGPGTATYSGVTTTSVGLSNIDITQDGWYFRMKVSTGHCDTLFTNAARLDIEGPITITADPSDISNCAGDEVFFVSEFSNPGTGTTFAQWQIADASTGPWTNVVNSGVYTGILSTNVTATGSDTLTITNVVGLDGKWYRVVYTSPTCSTPVPSAAAELNVSGNVSFSDHPDDITVCSGNSTTFTAIASIPSGTFTFGWQFSDNSGTSWTDIDFVSMAATFSHTQSGAIGSGTDVLTVSNVASMYNRRFRAVANATDCNSVYSNYAILSVEGPLSVSLAPVDVVECSGNATTFTAIINNPGLTGSTIVRWQRSQDNGSTWTDLTNTQPFGGTGTVANNGQTILSISNVAGLHNNLFRVSYRTSTCTIQYSASARLTVEGPITVTLQPQDDNVCAGGSASFTAGANVGTAGTLVYNWQVSSNNGTSWADLTADSANYTGYNATTLNVINTTGLYSRCYRLTISTGECQRVFTDRACLNIDGPIAFTAQPSSITQCSGEAVLFGAMVTNGSQEADAASQVQYQWQQRLQGSSTWTALTNDTLYNGVNSDSLSISYTTNLDSTCYRLLAWTDECSQLISSIACLDVEGPITVTDEPDNVEECAGSGVTFQATVAIQNGNPADLIYEWEESPDNGTTWNPLTDGGVYSGTTTTTLAISNVANKYNYRYRMRFRTPNCNSAWTNYALLRVHGPIQVTNHPDHRVVCSGSPVNFTVNTVNNGYGAISYQWQQCISGDSLAGPWVNIPNNSIFNGSTTANFSISNVSGFNGRYYRVLVQTAECSAVASYAAVLEVEGPIGFGEHPRDTSQCSGESVTFSALDTIAGSNAGTLQQQWQISSDGVNWTNITDGGAPNFFSGATTQNLTVGNVVGLNNWRFRMVSRTGVCQNSYSFPATLTVEGPLSINVNPANFTNCSDKEAFFASNAVNPGATPEQRQWQMSSNGGTTWTDITQLSYNIGGHIVNFAGYDSDTLLVSPIIGLNGYLFRNNFWTGTCNRITTTVAELTVEGPVTFSDQPDDVTLCAEESACFTIAIANSTGEGVIEYQWQRWTAGGWVDVTNTLPYSGAFTNQLCISDVTGLYNYKYRCGVRTGNCDWEYSDLANLFVEGPIDIILQPVDASVCSNRPHSFNTTITNPGSGQMTYRWQRSVNSGTTWNNIPTNIGSNSPYNSGTYVGAFGQDLSFTNVDGMNGHMFRLLISTLNGCADTTDEVTLTVLDKCLAGTCDLDDDGIINDNDPDDDNDQVTDYWEQWMTDNNIQVATTEFPGTGPWNYTVSGAAFPSSAYISYNRCLVDTDGDGLYDNQEDPDGDNINNGEETDGDVVFDGNPLDPCNPILGPTCIGINLAIRVNLQGARIGVLPADTLMRGSLRSYGVGANARNLIPQSEPYENMLAFAHNGTDGGGDEEIDDADSTAIFSQTGPNAVVDWVFVELRSSTALDSVKTTRAGLLQRDGDVVDMDGTSNIRFASSEAGTYYVAVRHRNHLGVMTGEALDLSPALQEIDFTDPAFPTSGAYGQLNLGGRMYMWAGDLNTDGRTIYQGPGNDVLKLFTTVLYNPANTTLIANFISEGYQEADVNLDGRAIYQGPLNDRSMLLLNTILSHPANVNLISNYVILETLP